MRQRNRSNCILVAFLLILCACSQDCKLDPKVGLAKIISSSLISDFKGESITPYNRKKGFLIFRSNDGGKFLVEQQTRTITKVFPGSESNRVQEEIAIKVSKKIQLLEDFCINGVVSDSTITFVYTNLADSSYQDLITADPAFRDIYYRPTKNKKYNYVLVNVSVNHQNDSVISKLTRLHSLKRISKQWYYFRSQYYSSSQ